MLTQISFKNINSMKKYNQKGVCPITFGCYCKLRDNVSIREKWLSFITT